MADDELVGNMNTELMIQYFEEHLLSPELNKEALTDSLQLADKIFIQHL
ncbi:MAG: hypothetical protein WDO16_15040 [Bacteroidota bacterium]